jgi:arsenate reductase
MPAESIAFYTYAKCSSCREAGKWLRAHRIEFVERPIFDTPPSLPELRRMLVFQGGNLRRLFNTSGLEYRALALAARLPTLTEPEALALLAGNGRLVKRPFLLGEKVGLLGFDPKVWAAALRT